MDIIDPHQVSGLDHIVYTATRGGQLAGREPPCQQGKTGFNRYDAGWGTFSGALKYTPDRN